MRERKRDRERARGGRKAYGDIHFTQGQLRQRDRVRMETTLRRIHIRKDARKIIVRYGLSMCYRRTAAD